MAPPSPPGRFQTERFLDGPQSIDGLDPLGGDDLDALDHVDGTRTYVEDQTPRSDRCNSHRKAHPLQQGPGKAANSKEEKLQSG